MIVDMMVSKVKVNMTLFGKHTTIEVSQRWDRDFGVRVETDCDNVREVIDMLGTLSLVDLTDKKAARSGNASRTQGRPPTASIQQRSCRRRGSRQDFCPRTWL